MLEVEGIEVRYGAKVAVADVSLRAGGGQITTVIGSNGAGKTTLLKAISGLLPTSAGTIRFAGEPINGKDPSSVLKRGIAQVPEGRELFPRMTVYDNLMVGAFTRRDGVAVRGALERIMHYFPVLKEKLAVFARNLSGGEQQMLAFGRAIMAGPKMLLLDEPSIGLAPLVEQRLIRSVEQLAREEGLGVLLIEQNAALALEVSSYGYVLDLGRVVLEGPASDLRRDEKVRSAYLGI